MIHSQSLIMYNKNTIVVRDHLTEKSIYVNKARLRTFVTTTAIGSLKIFYFQSKVLNTLVEELIYFLTNLITIFKINSCII